MVGGIIIVGVLGGSGVITGMQRPTSAAAAATSAMDGSGLPSFTTLE